MFGFHGLLRSLRAGRRHRRAELSLGQRRPRLFLSRGGFLGSLLGELGAFLGVTERGFSLGRARVGLLAEPLRERRLFHSLGRSRDSLRSLGLGVCALRFGLVRPRLRRDGSSV